MKKESTVVSIGNTKIGKTSNVSLMPIASCPEDAPCKKDCYACKSARIYSSALKKWASNLALWKGAPAEFELQIMRSLERKRPEYFRWAVAGDIPDVNYLRMMLRVARRFPDTKFLAFTKQYSILTAEGPEVPPNLTIVVSGWEGYRLESFNYLGQRYPTSWVTFKGKPSPSESFRCPGRCESCRACWGLAAGKMVEFRKH